MFFAGTLREYAFSSANTGVLPQTRRTISLNLEHNVIFAITVTLRLPVSGLYSTCLWIPTLDRSG